MGKGSGHAPDPYRSANPAGLFNSANGSIGGGWQPSMIHGGGAPTQPTNAGSWQSGGPFQPAGSPPLPSWSMPSAPPSQNTIDHPAGLLNPANGPIGGGWQPSMSGQATAQVPPMGGQPPSSFYAGRIPSSGPYSQSGLPPVPLAGGPGFAPSQSMSMNPYRPVNDPYRQGITDQNNPNYQIPAPAVQAPSNAPGGGLRPYPGGWR